MSAFYDQASLVVVPSGYKSGKIYAQKPLTTDGQLTFTRASTATRVNASGLIETVSSGVPRLDYTNSTCPKLLLEPQRSNLLLQSQTLDNPAWSLSSATISANVGVAPDGTTTADKLIPTNGADPNAANAAQLQQVLSVSSGTYTFSIFAKADGQNSVRIRENNSWGNFLNVNLTTGAFNIIGGNFNQFNNISINAYGNGWYRICFTTDAGVTNFTKYSIRGGETGDGTKGVLLWGAQFELGAYPTSYIPTTSAAVTRLADLASITGLTGKNIIPSSAAYTAFIEVEIGASAEGVSDKIILTDATNFPRAIVYNQIAAVAGWPQVEVLGYGATFKIAFRANSTTNVSFFKNGALVNTFINAGGGPLTFERMILDGTNGAFKIKQILLFPTALTNAQCIELTTP